MVSKNEHRRNDRNERVNGDEEAGGHSFGVQIPQQPDGQNEATDIVAQLLFDLGACDTHRHCVHNMLTVGSDDRSRIEEYIRDSQGPSHDHYDIELVEVYEIRNPRDAAFKQQIGDSRMLFHGTEKQNVYGILRDGFRWRIGSEAGRFGRGIYFSDCVSKASNYTSNDPRRFLCNHGHTQAETGKTHPEYSELSYLFLSEVAIGESREYAFNPKTHKRVQVLRGCDSAKGIGSYTYRSRQWETHYFKGLDFEASIPCGKLQKHNTGVELIYDEFVIYNSAQARHRFLLQCRFVPRKLQEQTGVSAMSDQQIEAFSRPHTKDCAAPTNVHVDDNNATRA